MAHVTRWMGMNFSIATPCLIARVALWVGRHQRVSFAVWLLLVVSSWVIRWG